MILREYQEDAVQAVFNYFANGGTGNPIVAMPTGTGKSVVIGEFARRAYFVYPQTRIMKLTHVKELIEQNFDKLIKIWPTAPAGIYSAGLGRKDVGLPILFGGVGTVARADTSIFGRIDLLLIDECHLLSPKDTTMYQVVIKALKLINPFLKVIGFTATPYRLGHGRLNEGEGAIFTDICIDMTTLEAFNWFLDQGYLSRLVPKPTAVELDVSKVGTHASEFKQNELQLAVDKDELNYAAMNETINFGHNRQHWLIFASGIEHATHLTDILCNLGVDATCVHSKMPGTQRDANIDAFKAGRYQAMVNNGILTTGFDFPGIDLISMLRPTQSASLWVQMLGRGTRPVYADGFDLGTREGRLDAIANGPKQNCLVLDFARNVLRLGPINDPVLPKARGKGGGVAPVRLCEACGTYNHASVRFCTECGVEFPRELKIASQAGTSELIAASKEEPIVIEEFRVDKVTYAKHIKDGRPDTIQVTYYCGLRMFKEWICLEHDGYAGKKSRDWWRESARDEPPETTKQALECLDVLRNPIAIRVWLRKKYDQVMARDYGWGYNSDKPL